MPASPAPPPRRVLARLRWTAPLGFLLLTTVALALGAARLLLGDLSRYRAHLETWVSDAVGRQATIGRVQLAWRGWVPEIALGDLRVVDEQGHTALRLERIELTPDLRGTLTTGELRLRRAGIAGARLGVVREVDGSFSLRGFGTGEGDREDRLLPALLLGARADVELADAHIVWEDRRQGTPPIPLSRVAVRVRNEGPRHRLEAIASLPGGSGSRAELALDAEGDLAGADWRGQGWLRISGLSLARWAGGGRDSLMKVREGVADVEVWSTWEGGQPLLTVADLRARGVTLGLDGSEVSLEEAGARLRLTRATDRWHLAVTDLRLGLGRTVLEAPAVEVLAPPAGPTGGFTLHADAVRLDTATDRGTAPGAASVPLAWLTGGAAGWLRELWLDFRPERGGEEALRASARLEGVTLTAARGLGALSGLTARVSGSPGRGRLELPGEPLALDVPGLFSEPLPPTAIAGALTWRRDEGRRVVESQGLSLTTRDLSLDLNGQVSWHPGESAPFASLQGQVHGVDLARVARYLPDRTLKPFTFDWLSQAFPKGRVEWGDFLLHGPLDAVPFDRPVGQLQVALQVADAALHYHPEWPRLDELRAEVGFLGRGLTVRADTGRILDARIRFVEAEIPDVGHEFPELTIRGQIEPSGTDALRVVRESTIKPEVRSRLRGLTVSGQLGLGLDLWVPLAHDDPKETVINGVVTLRDNGVGLEGVTFSGATGTLRFTREQVRADQVRARLGAVPVTVAFQDGEGGSARLRLQGQASGPLLERSLGATGPVDPVARALLRRLSGSTGWRAQAEIRHDPSAPGRQLSLTLDSDLKGLEIGLPAPLGKAVGEARRLRVEAALGGDAAPGVRIAYGDGIAATLELATDSREPRLVAARVALGPGATVGPPTSRPEVRVEGSVETLRLGEWLDLLQALPTGARPRGTASNRREPSPLPKHIDLMADRIELPSARLDRTRVQADFEPASGWTIVLRGDGASGLVTLPPERSGQPVVVGLDRLVLERTGGPSVPTPPTRQSDLRGLRPLELRCRELVVGGLPLGALQARARPQGSDIALEEFTLDGPHHRVTASGGWSWNGGDPLSRFRVEAESADLGELLRTLGYDEAGVTARSSRIVVDGSSPGGPADFSLARSTGRVTVELTDGSLADVSPGAAGRVFGLLSVQALPRRLKLDFTDLFGRGFHYDRIAGEFAVADGIARTEDFQVTGNAARIDIRGRVGLVAEDYDQVVTVTPNLSTTLPVAGAIAGGPVGAVAALVAQGLLKNQIDRAARFSYTVTGPWRDPVVERVTRPAPPTEEP